MTLPARLDDDDTPQPPTADPPDPTVWTITGCALVLAFIAILALIHPARAEDVSLSAGRRLAVAQCGGCHAVDLAGESPNPRAPRFRDLGARFPFDGLREALMQGMIVGHPQMPIIHLTQVESGDLTAYMRSLQPRRGQDSRQ